VSTGVQSSDQVRRVTDHALTRGICQDLPWPDTDYWIQAFESVGKR
jgi:hypothetical protein